MCMVFEGEERREELRESGTGFKVTDEAGYSYMKGKNRQNEFLDG